MTHSKLSFVYFINNVAFEHKIIRTLIAQNFYECIVRIIRKFLEFHLHSNEIRLSRYIKVTRYLLQTYAYD